MPIIVTQLLRCIWRRRNGNCAQRLWICKRRLTWTQQLRLQTRRYKRAHECRHSLWTRLRQKVWGRRNRRLCPHVFRHSLWTSPKQKVCWRRSRRLCPHAKDLTCCLHCESFCLWRHQQRLLWRRWRSRQMSKAVQTWWSNFWHWRRWRQRQWAATPTPRFGTRRLNSMSIIGLLGIDTGYIIKQIGVARWSQRMVPTAIGTRIRIWTNWGSNIET